VLSLRAVQQKVFSLLSGLFNMGLFFSAKPVPAMGLMMNLTAPDSTVCPAS
jgi:hypothetical protein